jgi:hypothetical protein
MSEVNVQTSACSLRPAALATPAVRVMRSIWSGGGGAAAGGAGAPPAAGGRGGPRRGRTRSGPACDTRR